MKNKNGFTLIELLAVIIILGIIMLIAIPSVTKVIDDSRRNSYVKNANQIVDGMISIANSGELDMYDLDTTYYYPASCIGTESGASKSTFGGDWVNQYVIVTYTGDGFDYYYTALDTTKTGMYITNNKLLSKEHILNNLDKVPLDICIGDRDRIVYFDESCDGSYRETYNVRHLVKDKSFYDPETATDVFQIHGVCKFNGKNGVIEGDGCPDYNGQKFIDTELQLFSERNAKKDFYIYFDIIRMDPIDQDDGKQWTLIADKLERGEYPGFCFRFAGNKLEFTQRIGKKLAIYYDIGEVKSFKLFRKDRILYYSINGEPLQMFQDTSNLSEYFDSTLYIGAAQDGDGKPFRHVNATISNLVVKMGDIKDLLIDSQLHTIFQSPGSCKFNGSNGVLEGTGCGQFEGQPYMDTGIKLFDSENSKKDFAISFDIEEYNPDNQDPNTEHNTFFSTRREETKESGVKVRKDVTGNNIEIKSLFNNSNKSFVSNYKNVKSVKIYRVDGILYGMFNNGTLNRIVDLNNYTKYFDDTLWFGASRDADGNPFRFLNATLSNIKVQTS